jgi:predicted secreted hydrolase
MDAGGMRFRVIDGLKSLRTTYDGSAVYLTEPAQMAEPRLAFKNNPFKKVKLELLHEAAGPAYGSSGADHKVVDPEKEFAKAHYEQHMKVRGTVEVDGQAVQIDGLGLRDHSWGPRYWQAIYSYRWLTINFAPDFGMMVSTIWRDPEHRTQAGVVVRGDKIDQIVRRHRCRLRGQRAVPRNLVGAPQARTRARQLESAAR